MSENPFAQAAGNAETPPPVATAGPKPPPGALQVISILCLILGVLGLISSCGGGLVFGFQSFFFQMIENAPLNNQNEFQKLNFKAATNSAVMIPNVLLLLFNFVVAPMLLLGGINTLRKKEAGRRMLRRGLLLGMIYNALKAVLGVVGQLIVMNSLAQAIDNYDGPGDQDEISMMFEMTQVFGIGGAVFAGLISLALLGFYFWARNYLNKPDVIDYFDAFNQTNA